MSIFCYSEGVVLCSFIPPSLLFSILLNKTWAERDEGYCHCLQLGRPHLICSSLYLFLLNFPSSLSLPFQVGIFNYLFLDLLFTRYTFFINPAFPARTKVSYIVFSSSLNPNYFLVFSFLFFFKPMGYLKVSCLVSKHQ